MPQKKRRQRCQKHNATGRSWDEYVFGHIDYLGTEIWRCRECKERGEKWLIHYERQKEEQYQAYQRKWDRYFAKQAEEKKRAKEELWDSYLASRFLHGVKNPDCIVIPDPPKELTRLMRATIKLHRLINAIKKGEYKPKKQLEEQKRIDEENRLKGIINHCNVHGSLFLKDVIKSGKSPWTGIQIYKCKACQKNFHKNYYARRKDYVLSKHAEYRKIKNNKKLKIL